MPPLDVPVLDQRQRSGRRSPAAARGERSPASGGSTLDPDGTVTFTPVEPGLQSFRYQVGDGQGGAASGARVGRSSTRTAGELDAAGARPGSTISSWPRSRAPARPATALDVVRLEGAQVEVRPPEPGTRDRGPDRARAGDRACAAATSPARPTSWSRAACWCSPRTAAWSTSPDFVDSAESGTPPTLAVAGGPAVASDSCSPTCSRSREPAEGPVVGRLPPPRGRPAARRRRRLQPLRSRRHRSRARPDRAAAADRARARAREFLIRGTGEFGDGERPTTGRRAWPGSRPGPGPSRAQVQARPARFRPRPGPVERASRS